MAAEKCQLKQLTETWSQIISSRFMNFLSCFREKINGIRHGRNFSHSSCIKYPCSLFSFLKWKRYYASCDWLEAISKDQKINFASASEKPWKLSGLFITRAKSYLTIYGISWKKLKILKENQTTGNDNHTGCRAVCVPRLFAWRDYVTIPKNEEAGRRNYFFQLWNNLFLWGGLKRAALPRFARLRLINGPVQIC